MLKIISIITMLLAFTVVTLGAYVRLSEAGLGCPDWPGCYGRLLVKPGSEFSGANKYLTAAEADSGKAWKEMLHRYAAGLLGILVLIIALFGWHGRTPTGLRQISIILLILVLAQSLLGMLTVTLLLQPLVVLGHLLGGLSLLALLAWLVFMQSPPVNQVPEASPLIFKLALVGMVILAFQIMSGGWTSSNYAALICPDFPTCRNSWWPAMDFRAGFQPWHGAGFNHQGGLLSAEAKTAVHMTHRVGALITLLLVGWISIKALLQGDKLVKQAGLIVLIFLVLQVLLGVLNIVLHLPLIIAVLHNVGASLLLLSMVNLLRLSRPKRILV